MRQVGTLVIGGGIAGLSLAARLACHGETVVLEAEAAPGYHASGRSVAFAHFGLGERVVRALTAMSLPFLAADPPDDRARSAVRHPALHIARANQVAVLDELEKVHRRFDCAVVRLSGEGARELCPVLRVGPEHCHAALLHREALKLDADAMLQGALRDLRANGAELVPRARVTAIRRDGAVWRVESGGGDFAAHRVVNAAGAWADDIAALAGARQVGIEPRRRTVVSFAGPPDIDVSRWPFVKTVGAGFYLLPEGRGALLASPMDQSPSAPCDAAPEELDIATIAHSIEQATDLAVGRIAHSWAGLRSFAADELPVIGEAAGAPGFFWFAGQGGYGFQTAPALARIGEALVLGEDWPGDLRAGGITPELFSPARFGG